ncbi:MAG: leucine--tRNA ligase [Planctomycetes bacterium]|nr:leucine--tRNA ligase [Planctomycetota bacterium]
MEKRDFDKGSGRRPPVEGETTDNFASFEVKWQERWALAHAKEADKTISTRRGDRKKFYVLSMFPYPSGRLHFGHALPYTLVDSQARYKRMQGFDVMNPMGWDAFGLPAENAAIESNIHPAKLTFEHIDYMRSQMHRFGYAFDWEREVFTCKPDYYKWTQWLFLKMLEKGVAYRKKARVNWCPNDKTVLANEQVETIVKDGEEFQGCFRCGTKVEPREIDAWFLRITDYADRLLDGLAKLDKDWPELVVSQQRNWIGRSEGVNIDFQVELRPGSGSSGPILPAGNPTPPSAVEKMTVFTTRADTVFGVTYVAIAPEHPLVQKILNFTDPRTRKKIEDFCRETLSMTEMDRAMGEEKEGVHTGMVAVNPLNGERVPLFIANYVLMYGTGAVMAVPAHDERDHDFAKGYRLKMKQVIKPANADDKVDIAKAAYTAPGVLIDSGSYTGLTTDAAIKKIGADLNALHQGGPTVNYKLRDWGISRQRYWGCPIPVVHCAKCGIVPVPVEQLPVVLPDNVDFLPTGQSPLVLHADFNKTQCPKCKSMEARRDTDTMDTFVDSSWYFLRYTDAKNADKIFDKAKVKAWNPVDLYVGGREHAILHLIYARFFTKFIHDLGLIDHDEPFSKLFTHGLIQGESIRVINEHMNRYVTEAQLAELIKEGKASPGDVSRRVEKMSKSKLNGADPVELINQYGADTVRLYILFLGPAEQDSVWDPKGIVGAHRFLKRWHETVLASAPLVENLPQLPSHPKWDAACSAMRHATHSLIEKATQEFEGRYAFNTAIAKCMELLNTIRNFVTSEKLEGKVSGLDDKKLAARHCLMEALDIMARVLAPIAPHTAEEVHSALGHQVSVFDRPWPKADPAALVLDEVEIAVTINGKPRATIRVAKTADAKDLEAAARGNEAIQKLLEGKPVKKLIAVPGRIVNIVV